MNSAPAAAGVKKKRVRVRKKPGKPGRPWRAWQQRKAGQPGKPAEKGVQAAEPAQQGDPEQPGKSAQQDKGGQAKKPGQQDKVGQAKKPGQQDKVGQAKKPGQQDKGGQAKKPGQQRPQAGQQRPQAGQQKGLRAQQRRAKFQQKQAALQRLALLGYQDTRLIARPQRNEPDHNCPVCFFELFKEERKDHFTSELHKEAVEFKKQCLWEGRHSSTLQEAIEKTDKARTEWEDNNKDKVREKKYAKKAPSEGSPEKGAHDGGAPDKEAQDMESPNEEVPAEESSNKEAPDIESSAKETSTKVASDLETSTKGASDLDTSTKGASDLDTSTKGASDLDTSTKGEADLETSTKGEADLETSTEEVVDLETSTEEVVDLETSPKGEADLETSTEEVVDLGTSPKGESDLETSTKEGANMETDSGASDVETSNKQASEMETPKVETDGGAPDMETDGGAPDMKLSNKEASNMETTEKESSNKEIPVKKSLNLEKFYQQISFLGLEHVAEYLPNEKGHRHYVCKLCSGVFTTKTIYYHVQSVQHRILFLSKYHKGMGIGRKFKVNTQNKYRQLVSCSRKVERLHGREKIKTIDKVYVKPEPKELPGSKVRVKALSAERDVDYRTDRPFGGTSSSGLRGPALHNALKGDPRFHRDAGFSRSGFAEALRLERERFRDRGLPHRDIGRSMESERLRWLGAGSAEQDEARLRRAFTDGPYPMSQEDLMMRRPAGDDRYPMSQEEMMRRRLGSDGQYPMSQEEMMRRRLGSDGQYPMGQEDVRMRRLSNDGQYPMGQGTMMPQPSGEGPYKRSREEVLLMLQRAFLGARPADGPEVAGLQRGLDDGRATTSYVGAPLHLPPPQGRTRMGQEASTARHDPKHGSATASQRGARKRPALGNRQPSAAPEAQNSSAVPVARGVPSAMSQQLEALRRAVVLNPYTKGDRGKTFKELKAAHAAAEKDPVKSKDSSSDGGKEKDPRKREMEDFWCNDELYDFLANFLVEGKEDVAYVLKITDGFANALVRHNSSLIMDEGQIVLIGNETDILHCGFSHTIKEGGKRYPSAEHYAHSMILTQLGLDDNVLLDLLGCSSSDVQHKARQLLLENMPPGHDLNSLASYLQTSRQSYTMQGLRLRIEQDAAFEKTLMDTKESLLIVCDSNDKELAIGMDEAQFVEWMHREKVDAQRIAYWMRNDQQRPPNLGQNQLGYFLMWLRYEVKEKNRVAMLTTDTSHVDGLSTDQDDKPVQIAVTDQVVALQGIFRPLSNYYPLPFEMKGEKYRSVEHYAYEKLFNALRLDDKQLEKIATTVLPTDLASVAKRVFKKQEIDEGTLEAKMSKIDRWRQSAMKHKIAQNEYLQQLLLSTGDALLIDNADGDEAWTCGAGEAELQRLLAKDYVNAAQLITWMRDEKPPPRVSHIKGNKTGLLLMELRGKFAANTTNRIPLVSPLTSNILSTIVTPHVICFTPESVWHPLYPAEIRAAPDQPLLPSPAHYVAQEAAKYLGFNTEDSDYVMEPRGSVECWRRLYEKIEERGRGLEREQSWFMERRQRAIKESLTLLLEQHPPLLRALLDTHDSMLVYCARWSSVDAELSIGMREHDFRHWAAHVDVDTKQLIELCTRPLAFRPAYLGGNRLGLILMELRREFILKGVFPNQLPDLPIGSDAILGTDSPTENLMIAEEFDVLDADNYTSLWINPMTMLAKKTKDATMLMICRHVKLAPRLVTMDDGKINDIVEHLDACKPGKIDQEYLMECAAEDLRAVFMRLCMRIRQKMTESDQQQVDMNCLAKEISHMQGLRRGLEENGPKDTQTITREQSHRQRSPQPPRMSGGRDRFNDYERAAPRRRSPDRQRRDYGREERDYGREERDRDRGERERRSRREDMYRRDDGPPAKKEVAAPTPAPPPKPKVPRPADEELSEGEIIDSDDD